MEDKIKQVLFIVTQSEMGGAQKFLLNLTSQLNPDKYEILVAVGSDGDGEFLKFLDKEKISHVILSNLKKNISPWHDFRAAFEIRKLIKKFQPDTLFLNSSKAGFLGSLAAVFPFKLATRNQKLVTIYRIGGWTFNDPWPKWKKCLWIFLERLSASWKDIVIVNSKKDLEQAQKLKIKPKQELVLIHNGIDVYGTEFLPAQEARLKLFEIIARHAGRIFQTKFVVGTIANFYPAKGLEHLISAVGRFRDREEIAFVVIGDGMEKESLKLKIESLKLKNKIFFTGNLPEAWQYLTAFDVFVLPSVKEGFPWTVLEAMTAKVPVIATEVGAIPEIIEDGKNGFVAKPGNPEMLAEKINILLNDDRLRQEFAIQGHQTVLFKFSLNKMMKRVEKLL